MSHRIPTECPRQGVPPRHEVSALVLAAGAGLRMCRGPKAFVQLDDATLLERAVRAVAPVAAQVIVGVCVDGVDEAREVLEPWVRELAPPIEFQICVGGGTRQETVSLLAGQADRRLILLHEVARPYVTTELFADVLAAADETGGAALYLPLEARDSVAIVAGDLIDRALPRKSVVTLQTPHAYRRDWLLEAHGRGSAEQWNEEGTAGLMRRAGYPIKLVAGSSGNVKLTFPEDLPRRGGRVVGREA